MSPEAEAAEGERLFTPRFFVMCGFTFTVFLSVFQLLPTAPFHIQDLGGGPLASGLFLGFLTYASALSAPFTGALADRLGRTRVLVVTSLVLAGFSAVYGLVGNYRILLGLVLVHGVVWSGLLSASAAYMTGILPPGRRAEGIAYWGLASVASIAVAPNIGFWIYRHGWGWLCFEATLLNLGMMLIALRLKEPARPREATAGRRVGFESRVLLLSTPLFLYAYGYGAITSFSAVYADVLGIRPKALYLTTLAVVMLVTRPFLGRLGDRIGYRRVFIPCLAMMGLGMLILPFAHGPLVLMLSAVVFGAGFGTSYPLFAAYVMADVTEARRGAAFGAILAAFDTGIGTGSTLTGWLIGRAGFAGAFGTAGVMAALALPLFLVVDRRFGPARPHVPPPVPAPLHVEPVEPGVITVGPCAGAPGLHPPPDLAPDTPAAEAASKEA